MSDSSHSCNPEGNESTANSTGCVKSAAMLGIALSVGASGALVSQPEASAAVPASQVPATTKAFSSEAKGLAATASEAVETSQQRIVAYHTVASGESLWQIAQHHRIGLQDLKSANELPPESSIRVGQVLLVPENGTVAHPSNSVPVPGTVYQSVNQTVGQAQLLADGPEASSHTADALRTDGAKVPSIEFEVEAASDNDSSEDGVGEFVASKPAIEPILLAQTEESEDVGATSLKPSPSIEIEVSDEIEIADASTAIGAEPVVTALVTPQPLSSYQIQAGDTLASIASSWGTTTQEIIEANGLVNPDIILTGDTLKVPSGSRESVARGGLAPSSQTAVVPTRNSERLAYLQSTAVRPDAARILDSLRNTAPVEPVSVGGEPVTEQNSIGNTDMEAAESVDPYVANLLEDVQAIRGETVQVSEVEPSEIESINSEPALLARNPSTERVESLDDQVALVPSVDTTASPDLLAAAPLSPDTYIPAQRPSQGQVVSPDMPLLPEAEEFLPEAPEYFDGYMWPTRGTVTSGYGWRWGRMHRGVDVAGPVGTPIVAAAMGVVEQAGWNSGGYGNLVEIRHPDGSLTRYAHNNRLNVSTGQTVKQGQQIAEMGSTGYSTGPHLHFEVHLRGQGAVNPVAYLPNN
ncbi:MAG: peptidoglycan DD-metalloendopeptidase family protein [Cyanobacteria bacterium J06631_12]